MTHQKRFWMGLMALLMVVPCVAHAATATRRNAKQSAIQAGTTIRERVAVPAGLYDQACYDAYYGCMDQFCVVENFNGGSCACSDQAARFEERMAAAKKTKAEAERIRLEEVERVNAGGAADIIFRGSRQYDKNGNVIFGETEDEKKAARRADLMAIFESSATGYSDEDMDSLDLLADKIGVELFRWAESVCMEYVPEDCDHDVQLLRQVYSKQITADCKGFENDVIALENEANKELSDANAAVRTALANSLENSNKYNLGECTVKFKECMQKDEACGADWENCVSTIASENMQNNRARSTVGTKVQTITKYSIAESTMEILNAKRNICERVLDSCMSVRDEVWPAFLRDAAPTLKNAEQIVESRMRQSCLTDISDCIQTACKDNIAGTGKDTMDACLSRPDMVRSFCKLEIDRCERMEPQIWDFVQDKLAALRVDACTQEVKDCFTADTRCGADFSNCIGMDYDYIHNICPIDSLVVCKQGNPKFSMDDLDSMLMGLYLNIDNAALTQCQNLVDTRMAEICGDKASCNRFAADDTIGTGSLRSQKVGTTYRVTGMISFGSIKMGEATGTTISDGKGGTIKLEPGEIGIQEYLAQVRDRNTFGSNDDATISLIEEELNNIAGTINRTIEMIEQDPQIQFCVSGRDLSQIVGTDRTKNNRKGRSNMTTARFPNLLNQVKMQIAAAALRKAQDNYNAKLNEAISQATRDASADLAQYMCQKIAENAGNVLGSAGPSTPLAPPYAISYDVGSGLSNEDLMRGGTGHSSYHTKYGSGSDKDVTATFNRDTRTCHVCTTVTDQSCKVKGGNWFRKKNTQCEVETTGPTCEDIPM